MSLSSRAEKTLIPGSCVGYYEKAVEAWSNPYDADDNLEGYINLSVAENKLSSPMIAEKLSSMPPIPPPNLSYTNAHGSQEAREIVAKFLQGYIVKTCVEPDQVILLNGAASVINLLSTLLCDAHEHVIVCGPGYRGFEGQLYTHANTNITVAHLDIDQYGSPTFPPVHSVRALQDALNRAETEGHSVRAILICSPHNPTGEVLSESLIRDIVSWARANDLHVIFDELYALSVHDEEASRVSVAQALQGDLGDDVHIVWSMSKDLCSSGVRLGVLYSHNKRLMKACASTYAVYASTSRLVEWSFMQMCSDFGWLNSFIEENTSRIRHATERCINGLQKLGVPFMRPSAGFFLLADFRRFMPEQTREAEHDLWKKMCDVKVLLTPSAEFYASNYGFFRICFAAVEPRALDAAWSKLCALLL